jgi:RNA recognition motif-containing protein
MNIYVGNLSFDATQADIEHAFGEYGEVNSVNIISDRDTGRSRGFGFVEMKDQQGGREAIEGLNLKEIAGRAVTVNEARPREDRGGGGRRW